MFADPLLGVALVRRAGKFVLVAGGSQAREECGGRLRSSGAVGHAGDAGEHVEDAAAVAHVVVADEGSPQRGRCVGVATAGEEHETAKELGGGDRFLEVLAGGERD